MSDSTQPRKSYRDYVKDVMDAAETADFAAAERAIAQCTTIYNADPQRIIVPLHDQELAHRAAMSGKNIAGLEWLLGLDLFATTEKKVMLARQTAEQEWEEGTRRVLLSIPDVANATTAMDLLSICEKDYEPSALVALETGMPWRAADGMPHPDLLMTVAFQNFLKILVALQGHGVDLSQPITEKMLHSEGVCEATLLFAAGLGDARETARFLVSQGVEFLCCVPDEEMKNAIFSFNALDRFPFTYFEVGGEINDFPNDQILERLDDDTRLEHPEGHTEKGFSYMANQGFDLRFLLNRQRENPGAFDDEYGLGDQLRHHMRALNDTIRAFHGAVEATTPDTMGALAQTLTETTSLRPAPHAGAALLQMAGAGMLHDVFEPHHWQHLPHDAVFTFRDRLAELLPAYHQQQLAEVDLTWANMARDGAATEKQWRGAVLQARPLGQNQR